MNSDELTVITTGTCFFHGVESVENPTVSCFECGHLFTAESFRVESDTVRVKLGLPPLVDIDDETICPLCTHDL